MGYADLLGVAVKPRGFIKLGMMSINGTQVNFKHKIDYPKHYLI